MSIQDAVYEAGLSPDRWQGVVDGLSNLFPGSKSVLITENISRRKGVAFAYSGFSDAIIDRYCRHLAPINPWVPVTQNLPLLCPAVSDDILPSSAFRGTEFYDEFILAEGGVESSAGIKLYQGADQFAMLNVHYGMAMAEQYNASVPELLRSLVPHLRNAIDMNRRLLNTPNELVRSMVEATEIATIVLTSDGRVWLANAAAEDLLESRTAARLDGAERLVITDPGCNKALNALKTTLLRGQSTIGSEQTVTLRDKSKGRWSFIPYCGARYAQSAWFEGSVPLVLVTFQETNGGDRLDLTSFSTEFGLTPAETRLASQIASGRSLKDASAEFGIGIGTARNQLKSVFQKTGVHRQSELTAMISQNYAP